MTRISAENRPTRTEVEVENYLSVGCPLVFHSDPFHKEAPRYSTILRGWRKPNYMLVDRPKVGGRYAAMRENQPCVIRFVHDGNACAFDSLVLDWDTRQYNSYCRILWPRAITVLSFRKSERIKANFPCKIKAGDNIADGVVQDISIGGCSVKTSVGVAQGTRVVLSFVFSEGTVVEHVQSVVRSARQVAEDFVLGCQFLPGQVVVENEVAFFVISSLNRTGKPDGGTRLLIISKDVDESILLKQMFEQQGVETLVVSGTLEGLARLKMTAPGGVIINQQQEELPGVLVARLIRTSPGYESLPLFLISADEATVAEQATRAGVTKIFATTAPKLEIVQNVVRQFSLGC